MLSVDLKLHFKSRQGEFDLAVEFESASSPLLLFGPSGSGKSLTFQCLAGLMQPQSGRIALEGREFFNTQTKVQVPAARRNIGYLFQDYALFPHLSLRDNIGFALSGPFTSTLDKAGAAKVESFIERFELQSVAGQKPGLISGGQRQRAALARALITEPGLLLLDEPFSALDPLLRRRMRIELKKLLAETAAPAMIITHDPEDVACFAQSVLLYKNGRITEALNRENFANLEEQLLSKVY